MFDAVSARSSHCQSGLRAALAAAVLTVGISGAPQVSSWTSAPDHAGVLLSAAEGGSLANSGIALIMGPSMMPTPSEHYAETVNDLFLQPHGFGGQLEVLTTPQEAYLLDESMAKGAKALTDRVLTLLDEGKVDEDHPVTVFGYSQSAALTTLAMQQLDEAGVPSSAVHFVLIGDSANPNGGLLVGFSDMPGITANLADQGVTLGNPTPNDLYPTSIYTLEYDGYADFPKYFLNPLSSLNAIMGMAIQHIAYLGLTPEQIADAVLLESSPDSMINSYVIPSEYLPLLYPLLFVPITGKPLYDLLEPVTRILVNLGYGNIDHGWNDGPADVPNMATEDMPNLDWSEVSNALFAATMTGVGAFVADLFDPQTYVEVDMLDNPALDGLLAAMAGVGVAAGDDPTVDEMLNGLTNMMWESLVGQYLDPAYWEAAS
ncbi:MULTISPECIES: PE-PPE domain-containing protein [Mycolicibacter]|uniref:PE-PPE domain-containing protein n=1 Tax=Mycolicibacter virginiensis TaxID=1795032 RepID=A0A9X7NYE4_9MYCO|nr:MULTISPECIES: PE-PPE domain-containing protein [Mycobacteriaceae]OBG37299.1 PE family protein [Mycolicibacter heraklionensis]OBJ31003.1 PE family protein [Mycolicibacter heraklionensis]PQM51910.1 PE-PPE domain-containing protein [Mycolicibacter virginiensis]ULP47440.1 PE-PPE domain-containing protein [Mycolicibacter virginiensis]